MSDDIRRILVPTDGSQASEAVFPAIMPLVRAFAPEVALLHVFENPDAEYLAPTAVSSACAALRTAGVNAHLDLREGHAAREILRAAQETKADLIAISTHGRRGVIRLIAGSVAEEVLRRAEVPVLVTRPGTIVHDWRTIAVALDGSTLAETVLPYAVRLARTLGASLHLVQVAFPYMADVMGQAPISLPVEDPMPYLKGVLTRLEAQGVTASAYAPEGGASRELLRHLEEHRVSLLCMTTHGRSGLSRLLLGSVAEQVVRGAPCPVLLRRIPADEDGVEPATIQGVIAC